MFKAVLLQFLVGASLFAADLPPPAIIEWMSTLHPSGKRQVGVGIGCTEALTDPHYLNHFLHNATIPGIVYPHVTGRGLADITPALGSEFATFVKDLKPQSSILLTGGGYGIYGWEFFNLGHSVTMINYHNFFNEQLAEVVALPNLIEGVFNAEVMGKKRSIASVGTISVSIFNRFSEITGVPLPEVVEKAERDLATVSSNEEWVIKPNVTAAMFVRSFYRFYEGMMHSLSAKLATGRFQLKEDLVQTGILKIPDQSVDLGIDYLDSFHYSSHRPQQLNNVYRTLKIGGRYFAAAQGVHDFVRLKDKSRGLFRDVPSAENEGWVLLPIYLARKYKSRIQHKEIAFTIPVQGKDKQLTSSVLILNRPDKKEIDFGKGIRVKQSWFIEIRDLGKSPMPPQRIPLSEYIED